MAEEPFNGWDTKTSMTDLSDRLERLGLTQYLEIFVQEGFDTWETVLDITESDLNFLNVKLGHRRKLQRAIFESRGQLPERVSILEHRKVISNDGAYRSDDSAAESKDVSRNIPPTPASSTGTVGTKRKYRRHPKPDENAPERPASAYVIFSNQVREELRGQELSFAEIAKLVGERWQVLSADEREACERQAAAAKEKYYAELAEYKKTVQYSQYQEYLAQFKAKHAAPRTEGKRSRLEMETTPSTRSNSMENAERGTEKRPATRSTKPGSGHTRTNSNSQVAPAYFPLGSYSAPSASTSPTIYSSTIHSPIAGETHSPRSSPPAPPGYYNSYDLPYHARAGHAADLRTQQTTQPGYSPVTTQAAYWGTQGEDSGPYTATSSDYFSRRPIRSAAALPPLVHNDTTISSDGSLTSTPYQGVLLPVLSTSKADRLLPQPVPTTIAESTLLDQRLQLPSPALASHEPQRTSQWPALLRATELARDAEIEESTAKGEKRI
ncbi:hypothetical protein EJ06DRAFT_28612 [Trichodelitschia bisporula]|uniref:HMG box domain-containing protein n=1 Tax=Trichodelitschia bisporula TaxID=703511 RepID=A0A6G1IBD8_9PEZI|nr:hypothetical protein EJ06DRAFT_28612 [Trichodelitschia bisporula]